jgi:hypothetical protein
LGELLVLADPARKVFGLLGGGSEVVVVGVQVGAGRLDGGVAEDVPEVCWGPCLVRPGSSRWR